MMHSGLIDSVRPGHKIMADRKFLIRDMLLEKQVKLGIPPFYKEM